MAPGPAPVTPRRRADTSISTPPRSILLAVPKPRPAWAFTSPAPLFVPRAPRDSRPVTSISFAPAKVTLASAEAPILSQPNPVWLSAVAVTARSPRTWTWPMGPPLLPKSAAASPLAVPPPESKAFAFRVSDPTVMPPAGPALAKISVSAPAMALPAPWSLARASTSIAPATVKLPAVACKPRPAIPLASPSPPEPLKALAPSVMPPLTTRSSWMITAIAPAWAPPPRLLLAKA